MPAAHLRSPKVSSGEAPVSVGSGFVALDLLLVGNDRVRPSERYVGGSCGNVLSILSHLDWNSYPVARLGTDRLAQHVLADFEETGVNTEFVYRAATGVTPVVVVRLAEKKDGSVQPRFEWKHPESGEWLPRYRPFPQTKAKEVANQLPDAAAFYFDRAEKSALVMAEEMRNRGAVVFFEPSSCKDDEVFTQCLAVSDIVKYSADRISTPPRNPVARSPRLEIQTLGSSGLRYRLKSSSNYPGGWRTLPAFAVNSLVDTTGCGDWCSAGIINKLCRTGRDGFLETSEDEIVDGLRYGLALAAVNCQYQGARGPMYHLSRDKFSTMVQSLLDCRSRPTCGD